MIGAPIVVPQAIPSGSIPTPISAKKVNRKKILIGLLFGALVATVVLLAAVILVFRKTGSFMLSPFLEGVANNASNKTVMNPLTGELYTPEEAASWTNLRPMGVMINNHVDARPQSGLARADLVYEIVAEGGITRFLAFFLSDSPEKIGPVRSTREYYLVLVKELGDAMIMHIGWSPQALTAIETWPVRSLARGGATFWRDTTRNVATEHTAYVNGKDLRALADSLGWGGIGEISEWQFSDDLNKYVSEPQATELTIDFWYEGDYSGVFKYAAETNSYMRFTGYDTSGNPIAHLDNETQEQISVKNVIVQFVMEVPIAGDEKNRLTYELEGSGEAVVFLNGKAIKSTWTKEGRDDRTVFYDLSGNEIAFNRGKIWVSIVPSRNSDQVVY